MNAREGMLTDGGLTTAPVATDIVAPGAADPHAWLHGLEGAAWLVDAASLHVVAANGAAQAMFDPLCCGMQGTDAAQWLPSLEDSAYWSDVRAGVLDRLESEVEFQGPRGRTLHLWRRIVPLPRQAPHQDAATLLRAATARQTMKPGDCALLLVQAREVTSALLARRERETLLAELRATLEATAEGILVVDLSGHIRAFNRRFAQLWNLPDSALAARDDDAVFAWMRMCTLDPAAYQRRLDDIAVQTMGSGTDQIALMNGAVLERRTQPQWQNGRPSGRVYSFRELNERRPGASDVQPACGADPCGVAGNLGNFMRWLQEAIDNAGEQAGGLAVLCVEFDRHALWGLDGEAAVRQVKALTVALRDGIGVPHRLARTGAARYAVLLPDGSDELAAMVARRLCALSATECLVDHALRGLTVNVGLARWPQAGLGAADVLRHAEAALQLARQEGTSGWRAYRPPVVREPHRRDRLSEALEGGPRSDCFAVHYQGCIDFTDDRLCAFDAVLRWHDPARGLLMPDQFMPMARQAGLAAELDSWLLQQVLHQLAAWAAQGRRVTVSVPVVSAAWLEPGYTRRLAGALEQLHLDPAQLQLRVGECDILAEGETAALALQALRELRVRVFLDDFGSGASSLGALQRSALAGVRLDRLLLRRAGQPGGAPALLQAMVAVARALRLEVQAAGVETDAQHALLRDSGCRVWQGHLHARPTGASGLDVTGFPPAAPTPPDETPQGEATGAA